jgi:hypothetical protein
MQSEVLRRDEALFKRFGPMGIVIDGKLRETRTTWENVMSTATDRFNTWGKFEDDDAFHYACQRLNEIDAAIRDLTAAEQAEAQFTTTPFASLAAMRAVTEGDVQADWKAYCRKQFDADEPAHFAGVHTGEMADPSYHPDDMPRGDRVIGWMVVSIILTAGLVIAWQIFG